MTFCLKNIIFILMLLKKKKVGEKITDTEDR